MTQDEKPGAVVVTTPRGWETEKVEEFGSMVRKAFLQTVLPQSISGNEKLQACLREQRDWQVVENPEGTALYVRMEGPKQEMSA